MSTVKSKKLQVGTDATSSNNFTIYQPATPDGTLRIGVGNADSPTEIARFDATGMISGGATPDALSTATGSAPSYSARVWVNFNGTGTVAILASGNVSSLTDNGVGDYTINFTTAMVDTNYVMTGCYDYIYNGQNYFDQNTVPQTFSTSSIRIIQGYASTTKVDAERILVSIFR